MADLYKILCPGWMGDFSIDNLYTLYPKADNMLKLQTVSYYELHPVTTKVFLSLLLAFMLKFKHS